MTDRLNKLKKNCETCFFGALYKNCKSCNYPHEQDVFCALWTKHLCNYCGGVLVKREYKGRTYFYCYSCHMEFERG